MRTIETMESLYILIPIAVILVFVAVLVFIWAVKTDQFDDLERQGMNVLFDDDEASSSVPHSKRES